MFMRPRAFLSWLRMRLPYRWEGCWWGPITDDEIVSRLRRGGTFEPLEVRFVSQVSKHVPAFWDAGANFGLFSVIAAKVMRPNGQVAAFEPDPGNVRRLRRNIFLNRLRNVEVVEAALADREGAAEFMACEQGSYSGLKIAAVPAPVRNIRVRQTTLDAAARARGWPPVGLLKVDVEGAELLVVRGGREFFETRVRPVVMAEFSDRRTVAYGYRAVETYDWLAERGYKWFRLSDGLGLNEEPRRGTYDYDNLVGCPSERISVLRQWLGCRQ